MSWLFIPFCSTPFLVFCFVFAVETCTECPFDNSWKPDSMPSCWVPATPSRPSPPATTCLPPRQLVNPPTFQLPLISRRAPTSCPSGPPHPPLPVHLLAVISMAGTPLHCGRLPVEARLGLKPKETIWERKEGVEEEKLAAAAAKRTMSTSPAEPQQLQQQRRCVMRV